jgi:hypothetical protein
MMATVEVVAVRGKIGAEDVEFGLGTTTQNRGGKAVQITQINSVHIPYDSTRSVKDMIDYILTKIPE